MQVDEYPTLAGSRRPETRLPDHRSSIKPMDLTPIRIRGKKRKLLRISQSSQSATPLEHLEPSPLTEPKRRKKTKKRKGTAPAMPTLQGLPQELLEIIFLYSGNINLPQCSASLGRRLSSQAVTMEFTMQSFFHTVDHKANIRHRTVTSDPALQSAILSCRFFTWEFFLAYVQRAHDAMIKQRGRAWEQTSLHVPGITEFGGLWPFRFTKVPYLSFAEGFHIPEKLLHGPWTKDKASLLYVLVSLNGEIGWSGSMSGEVAKGGIRKAIKEDNEHAVAALSVLLGIAKAIDTEILRYAVVQCGCNVNILRHLLFNAQILAESTPKETLNFLDPQLWQWTLHNPDKGEVLKTMLRSADQFDLEFYFEEDADWTKIVSFPYGGSKFDTRTAFDRMVRELLTNLYMNYGRKITRRRAQRRSDDMPLAGLEAMARYEEIGQLEA